MRAHVSGAQSRLSSRGGDLAKRLCPVVRIVKLPRKRHINVMILHFSRYTGLFYFKQLSVTRKEIYWSNDI